MGELRHPGQQAGAEPDEEKQHRLKRGEAIDEPLLRQQRHRKGSTQQIVIMQIVAGECTKDDDRRG